MIKKYSIRSLLTAGIFVISVFSIAVLSLVITPPKVLLSERRMPAKMPEISFSGEFGVKFEGYLADAFPFRDEFRTVRAATVFYVLQQSDKDGLYFGRAGVGKLNRVDKSHAERFADKIITAASETGTNNLYFSLIPDKSSFYDIPALALSTEEVIGIMSERLTGFKMLDIAGEISAQSFYRTDLHWKQTEITGAAEALLVGMNAPRIVDFERKSAGSFQGVYSGQLALALRPDRMEYLTNDAVEGASVEYLSQQGEYQPGRVYSPELFAGRDPYDFFLHGAQAVVRIDNPANDTGRELFVFRDSFASALAPLLIQSYSRITLIDLRYINMETLKDYVSFSPDADVLFIYGVQSLTM